MLEKAMAMMEDLKQERNTGGPVEWMRLFLIVDGEAQVEQVDKNKVVGQEVERILGKLVEDCYAMSNGKIINLHATFKDSAIVDGDSVMVMRRLRGGNRQKDQGRGPPQTIRVATWNVNSVHTAEAELYRVVDEENLDVLFL